MELSDTAIFVYGTLMMPAVTTRVIGRMPEGHPARLKGFRRFRVDGASYPGIVPEAEASVEGLLLSGVTKNELAQLDAYEGSEYLRETCRVSTASGEASAQVYVYIDPARMTDQPWERPDHPDWKDLGW